MSAVGWAGVAGTIVLGPGPGGDDGQGRSGRLPSEAHDDDGGLRDWRENFGELEGKSARSA